MKAQNVWNKKETSMAPRGNDKKEKKKEIWTDKNEKTEKCQKVFIHKLYINTDEYVCIHVYVTIHVHNQKKNIYTI